MIFHDSFNGDYRKPFGAAEVNTPVRISAKADTGDLTLQIRRFQKEPEYIPMQKQGNDWFWADFIPTEADIYWYCFCGGWEKTQEHQLTAYVPEQVPDWWKEGICYQIFPDRFSREKNWEPKEPEQRKGTHRFLIRDWNTPPFYPQDEQKRVSSWPFWGGTLKGIEEKLDYLTDFGVTVLYINPIFEATSNHRYDTADYMKIDPLLGTEADFVHLCKAAEKKGIRIVLDGVFNHTGADSKYFDKFGNYQSGEAYKKWFRFGDQYPNGYDSWWGVPDLPNVEESEPTYQEFICGESGVVRKWLRAGASGWRLDVVDEIPDFLVKKIRTATREEKSDSLLLGEVWEDASNKESYGELRRYFLGEELDATMHYPFRTIVTEFLLGKTHAEEAWNQLRSLQENYPPENQLAALNLLGSHDRPRVLTLLGGDKQKVKQASFLQYVFPGVPEIYYGDEVGMTGESDPYNRGPFPWDNPDEELKQHYQSLGKLYAAEPLLRRGNTEYLYFGCDVLGCRRYDENESILALVNRGEEAVECFGLTVPAQGYIYKKG